MAGDQHNNYIKIMNFDVFGVWEAAVGSLSFCLFRRYIPTTPRMPLPCFVSQKFWECQRKKKENNIIEKLFINHFLWTYKPILSCSYSYFITILRTLGIWDLSKVLTHTLDNPQSSYLPIYTISQFISFSLEFLIFLLCLKKLISLWL